MDDETKSHARFLILYHLIFACKYRKKLLNDSGDETKRIFEDIATVSDCSFDAMEVDQDHIHCLVKSEPRLSPLTIVWEMRNKMRPFDDGGSMRES